MAKELLLITSEKVGFTGSVSFGFIFQADMYDKYDHCQTEHWGYAHQDKDRPEVIPYNVFKSGQGMVMAGALGQGADFDDKQLNSFPDKFVMLCDIKTADVIEKLVGEKIKIIREVHKETLLTS